MATSETRTSNPTPLPSDVPVASISQLAWMQRIVVLVIVATSLAWAWWLREMGTIWTLGGILTWVLGYLVFMALEWIVLVRVHGDDPSPAPSFRECVQAWWAESHTAPKVFLYWQPFRWARYGDSVPDDVNGGGGPESDVAPAVFIHGFVCNRGLWAPWMKQMSESGMPYVSVNLEPVFGSIEDYIPIIEAAIQRAERLGKGRPTLICHSMGGLAARAWRAHAPDNAGRVARVVTIGSPHHGTWLGRFGVSRNGQEMRRGSDWLERLSVLERALATTAGPYSTFVCWYSNTDNIVFPASTATLAGADNRLLRGKAHVAMAFDRRVMRETLEMLRLPA